MESFTLNFLIFEKILFYNDKSYRLFIKIVYYTTFTDYLELIIANF